MTRHIRFVSLRFDVHRPIVFAYSVRRVLDWFFRRERAIVLCVLGGIFHCNTVVRHVISVFTDTHFVNKMISHRVSGGVLAIIGFFFLGSSGHARAGILCAGGDNELYRYEFSIILLEVGWCAEAYFYWLSRHSSPDYTFDDTYPITKHRQVHSYRFLATKCVTESVH